MFFYLLIATCYLLFASCATSPKAGAVLEDGSPDFSLLPPGANLYLWADIEKAKPLLDALSYEGLSVRSAKQVLDRTDSALAAFYSDNASRRFFLATLGNYPNLRAGASMSFGRGWKRVKSDTGNRYWYSSGYKMGVAVGPKLAMVSDGDPFAPGQGSNPSPQGFEEFRRTCVMSGWLNNPGDFLNSFISKLGIPLQLPAEELFFGVARSPADKASQDASRNDTWELVLKIKTSSAAQARSLVSLFSFARLFIQRGDLDDEEIEGSLMSPLEAAMLFFANPPVQDAEFLTLRIDSLSEYRIALLFNMFSAYAGK